MGKDKRITNIDNITIAEKKKVAPNAYHTEKAFNQKVTGVYLGQNKWPKQGLVDIREFAQMGTPAPVHYNKDNYKVMSQYSKVPIANMKRDMVVRSPERKKDNSPSPHSYPARETAWTGLAQHEKVKNFSFKKDKSHFLDATVKQ